MHHLRPSRGRRRASHDVHACAQPVNMLHDEPHTRGACAESLGRRSAEKPKWSSAPRNTHRSPGGRNEAGGQHSVKRLQASLFRRAMVVQARRRSQAESLTCPGLSAPAGARQGFPPARWTGLAPRHYTNQHNDRRCTWSNSATSSFILADSVARKMREVDDA